MEKSVLKVNIRSRGKVYFDDTALFVASHNATGDFDVLPKHANFISLIADFIIIRKEDGTEKKFDIKTGVLKTTNNDVRIYLNTGRKKRR